MFRQPLIIAYHLIWTAYGWWLPNDPRGSGSKTIRNDILAQLGELHFGRKTVQPAGREIREFYKRAAELLRHPLLNFDDGARQVIASAFAHVIEREKLTCWACVVMPDHVHLVIRKHKLQAEDMIDRLKEESAARSRTLGPWAGEHPVWGGGGWKVFLDHPDEVRRTVPYVERNPDPYHLPRQTYPFVQPYDGWPLHSGHSQNSPYVKALRAAAGRYPH
jgi:REP element-mobilizing transposase RayT